MASITITNSLLGGLRGHLAGMFAYGRYMVGGSWYRAEMNSSAVQANGAVHATFYIQPQAGAAVPATKFQLCAADGTVLAERTETVAFNERVEKILVRFKFGVSVV